MTGITITQLKPTGKIKFENEIFEGRSFDGSVINKDISVTAVKISPFEIEVKPTQDS